MELGEFVAADPHSASRQELVRGEARPLRQSPDSALRAMQLAQSLASVVRRVHAKANIAFGDGYGYPDPAGDEYRVADIVLSLPNRHGRAEPTVICLAAGDPYRADAEELDRLRVFQACPTVRQILLFAPGAPAVRVFRRHGALWSIEDYGGRDAVVPLAGLKGSLFLEAAYADLFPDSPD